MLIFCRTMTANNNSSMLFLFNSGSFFCVESNRGFFCFNKTRDRTSATTVSWRRVSNINNIDHAARAVQESTCNIDSLALLLFLFRLSGNPPFYSDPLSDDHGKMDAPLRKPRPGLWLADSKHDTLCLKHL